MFKSERDPKMLTETFINFTETADEYLKYIRNDLQEPASRRAIVRMWGSLPVNKTALLPAINNVRLQIVNILQFILSNLAEIMVNSDNSEWDLFKDGLTLSIYIEMISVNTNVEYDSVTILLQTNITPKQKEEIVHALLQQFLESRQVIQRPNWTDLLRFIDRDKRACDYLKLSSSFGTFFRCSKYILGSNINDGTVQNRIKQVFDTMIEQGKLESKNKLLIFENDLLFLAFLVKLNDIVMFLKLLQEPAPKDEKDKRITNTIHSIIETSIILQNKIINYLSRLIISENNLNLLHEMFQYYCPILLINIEKQKYLEGVFDQNLYRSYEFYKKWFELFLCDAHYSDSEREWICFQRLMDKWLNKLMFDNTRFRQLLIEIDDLLDQLNSAAINKLNNRRFAYFIKLIIDKLFKQSE